MEEYLKSPIPRSKIKSKVKQNNNILDHSVKEKLRKDLSRA